MFDIVTAWVREGSWGYLAVAVGAAIPWLELAIVIPPAVLLDLQPVLVASVAFVGNFLPVMAIVAGYESITAWRSRRRGGAPPARSRRTERARRLLVRWGAPGVALLGPITTGIHVAVLAALAMGADRRTVLVWSAASLGLWAVAVTAATVAGADTFLSVGLSTEWGL